MLIATAYGYAAGLAYVGLAVLFGLLFWERRRGEPLWQRSALDRPIVAFLGVLVISSAVSEWRWLALGQLVLLAWVGFVTVRAVTLTSLHDETFARRVLRAFAFGGAVIGGVAVLTAILGIGISDGRVHLGIGSNGLGTIFAVTGVLLLGVFVGASGRWRVLACAGLSGVVLGLILTWSRGGWLAGALGVMSMGLLAPSRRLAVCVLAATIVAAAASPLILARAQSQSSRLKDALNTKDIRSRPAIWRTVPHIVTGHLVLGVGFGAFPIAYTRVVPEAAAQDLFPHAHNIFLSFLAETGIAGLATFIGVLAATIAAMWRWHAAMPSGSPDRIMTAGALAALIALFGHQLVDITLFGIHIAAAFLILMGLGAAGDLRRRRAVLDYRHA